MQINWKNCAKPLTYRTKKERIEEIEGIMEEQGFWDNLTRSQEITKELKQLKDSLETIEHLQQKYEDLGTLIEMGEEENDASIVEEVEQETKEFIDEFDSYWMQLPHIQYAKMRIARG